MDDAPHVSLPTQSSSNLASLAIDAALDMRFEEAIKLNTQIIEVDPTNVDALNRQARAYFELGNLEEAKNFYTLALKYDQYNPIAQKNLKIIQATKSNGAVNGHIKHMGNGFAKISPSLFLQEPGKTKIVTLIKVAEPQKLSATFCGMGVDLLVKNRGITVVDPDGTYLGVLPDDTAHSLLRLIKGGNKYQAIVKGIKLNGISIMIKEVFRSSKFKNQPSFLEYSAAPLSEIVPRIESSDGENEEMMMEEEEEQV